MKAFLKFCGMTVINVFLIYFVMPLVSDVVIGASLLWVCISMVLAEFIALMLFFALTMLIFPIAKMFGHPPVVMANLMRRLGIFWSTVALRGLGLLSLTVEILLAQDIITDISMTNEQCIFLALGIFSALLGWAAWQGRFKPAHFDQELAKLARG